MATLLLCKVQTAVFSAALLQHTTSYQEANGDAASQWKEQEEKGRQLLSISMGEKLFNSIIHCVPLGENEE